MPETNTQIERLRQVVRDSQANQSRNADQTADRLRKATEQSKVPSSRPKPMLRDAAALSRR